MEQLLVQKFSSSVANICIPIALTLLFVSFMTLTSSNSIKMARSEISPLRVLTALPRHAFDARLTAPLLVALLYYPDKVRDILPAKLHSWISSPIVIHALKIALGLAVIRRLSNKLSHLAANNFQADAKFIKSQEIVLISGGCSGIGLAMAEFFSKHGVKVVIMDLNSPKETLPSGVHFYQSDVTSSSNIASTAVAIRKDHGNPTVLINNAGVATCRTVLDEREDTEAAIRNTFEVNTLSHFWMCREFLPAMIKNNHGHVVTIASMATYVVHAQNTDYCCTKASALAFHEGLSSELRSRYNAAKVRTTIIKSRAQLDKCLSSRHKSTQEIFKTHSLQWIRTPLTAKLSERPEFKDSVLEPADVAAIIGQQVLSGRGGQLILPETLTFLTAIRGWPTWLQLYVRNGIANHLKFYKD